MSETLFSKTYANIPLLAIKGLCTQFGEQIVHQNLHLELFKGDIFGLIGGSGSGKSTILNTMLGLIPLQTGTIYWMGNIAAIADLRHHWGVQFQAGALLSIMTLGENIAMPLQYIAGFTPQEAASLALAKMASVGLKLTDYDKPVSVLSGGMIKRAALARAIALDPLLLFLDEPTSGLDPASSHKYDLLIKELHQNLNLTVIMITHDLLRVRNLCNRVGIIHNKQLYSGTLEEMQHYPDENIRKHLEDIT